MRTLAGRIRIRFGHSLTKNWPGGRRKATVIVAAGEDRTVPDWNRQVAASTRPYWPASDKQDPAVEAAFAGLEPGSKATLSGFEDPKKNVNITVTHGAPGTVCITG